MSNPDSQTVEIRVPLTCDEHALLDKLTPAQLDEARRAAADAGVAAAIRIRGRNLSEPVRSVDLRDQPPAD